MAGWKPVPAHLEELYEASLPMMDWPGWSRACICPAGALTARHRSESSNAAPTACPASDPIVVCFIVRRQAMCSPAISLPHLGLPPTVTASLEYDIICLVRADGTRLGLLQSSRNVICNAGLAN
ncbi:hypothetical protein MIND_00300700 [Mycena indigotica]|uniref:Uncharacterized protein n=1 Tax=Mycena indigotica TaxID=2126181 RepID=A0A8H6T1Q5_9AGAR|nr:uncharacterized protein MIND_00300700 [Mycena indigotica]KAF7309304.1 hypothetical protein MIND_00300700 [Mycena indigotica]